MRVGAYLAVLSAMITASPWNQLPLTVTFFDENAQSVFLGNQLSKSMILVDSCIDVTIFSNSMVFIGKEEPAKVRQNNCAVCSVRFAGESRIVACPDCDSHFHVLCAINFFPQTRDIIPQFDDFGVCGVCQSTDRTWTEFARTAVIVSAGTNTPDNTRQEESEEEWVTSSSDDEALSHYDEDEDSHKAPPAGSLRDRLYQRTKIKDVFRIYFDIFLRL
jgi:hypothetical protein